MHLKSILNYVEKQKGFVYSSVQWAEGSVDKAIWVTLEPHARSKPVCSGCGEKCSGYDRLIEREFQFIPLWNIPVFFYYAMRRVNCPDCGIVVERVPWCKGKQRTTLSYRVFLANWARSLSWKETARRFGTSWDTVYRSVQWVVKWGLNRREFGNIEAIGVDEIAFRRGHKYLTLVYQVDAGRRRLLYVAKDRTENSFRGFFQALPETTLKNLKFICSDMWSNYLKVAAEEAGHAVRILDRFHVMKKLNEKINAVRAAEAKAMNADGYEPVLKNSRWVLLKRPENLTDKQTVKLKELLQYNLRSVRAYTVGRQVPR